MNRKNSKTEDFHTELEILMERQKNAMEFILRGVKGEDMTDEELAYFAKLCSANPTLIDSITSACSFNVNDKLMNDGFQTRRTDLLMQRISEKQREKMRKKTRLIKYLTATVSTAAVIIVGIILHLNQSQYSEVGREVIVATAQIVKVPTVITDGELHIELESISNSITASEINNVIASKNATVADEGKIRENRVIIPAKCRYTITLEDGTIVTLNAGSELVYPTRFSGNERTVSLVGEAFFDVAKSDTPFVVNTHNAYIKVYGTKFNVKSVDSVLTQTILVEGIIGMGSGSVSEILLRPEQMAVMEMGNDVCIIENINSHDHLGWLDNYFRCNNQALDDFIRDFAGWYGISVKFRSDKVISQEVNLSISKDLQIDEFISVLETMLHVKFIKKGGDEYVLECL